MRKPRALTLLGSALVAIAGILTLLTVTTAGAQNPGDPALVVTDYGNYPDTPQAGASAACSAEDVLLDGDGAGFTLNGGPLRPTLAALGDLQSGDVITASLFVTPDCVGSVLSVTLKDAEQPFFDPSTNQINVGFESVSGVSGLTTITFTVPPIPGDDCFYQLDAVVGYPLAIVGPDGSFYNPANRGGRGRNMLIDASNGALTACVEATTTTTSTTSSTTSTTGPSTTSTTTPSTTSSTASTTPSPSAPTTSPPRPTTTAATPTTAAAAVLGARVQQAAPTIPATGSGDVSWQLTLVAVLLLGGVASLSSGFVLRRRHGRA